jgi:S1-C subfamily serine protease
MEAMTPIFFLLTLLAGVTMNPLEMMVHRNVQVTTENGECAGIILTTGVVLTAFHALETDSTIKVNGKEAEIALTRPDIDLIVLHVETEEVPDITFGTGVGVATPVVAIGNPVDTVGLISFGHVVFIKKNHIYTDTLAMHGFSGGGLYTTDGVLIGMMQGITGREKSGSWVVISVSAEIIIGALK